MLDFQTILPYLKVDENGIPVNERLLHAGYKKSIEITEDIKDVFNTDKAHYPKFLKLKRPKEKKEHTDYREMIYLNKVMKYRTKGMSLVTTIQQNDDYNVTFKKDSFFKDYTNDGMFENQTLPEWFFTEWTKFYFDDPNAVIAPCYKEFASTDTEYNKPMLKIFSSEGVIQLNQKICVLRGDEKTWIKVSENGDRQEKIGRNLYFYDKDSFVCCKQIARTNKNQATNYTWQIIGQRVDTFEGEVLKFQPFRTNTTKVPAQRIGRILGEKIDGEVQLYNSEISDALPYLKTIGIRISDAEIEYLQHIHTIEYLHTNQHQCNEPGCSSGWLPNPAWPANPSALPKLKCQKCDDKGFPLNGLTTLIITHGNGGIDDKNTGIPDIPIGYAKRNIETVQELEKAIERNETAAWGTLDMMYMFETPLNTSGKSKAYDRQDNNTRRADVSMHFKKQMDFGYDSTACFMGGEKEDIIPIVNVPTDSFDLLTQEDVLEEMKNASGVVDGNSMSSLGIVWGQKRFGKDTELVKLLKLKNRIDPYVSIYGDRKVEQLNLMMFNDIKVYGLESEKLMTQVRKKYLSMNLDSIIRDLTILYPDFLDWEFTNQNSYIQAQLELYLPDKISEDVYKPIKQEPMVDVVKENQLALN